MVLVIKKNGRKQSFSVAKLKRSVARAAKEAGLNKTATRKVISKVAGPIIAAVKKKETIKSSALRKSIMAKLNRYSKPTAKVWRGYERKKK